ncbi:MAG: S-layer homology domain-containing protein, partial [Oscillospiraceae bacterium]
FTISSSGLITPKAPTGLCMVTVRAKNDLSVNANFKFKIVAAPLTPAETLALLDAAITKVAATYAPRTAAWWGDKFTGDWWHATAVGAYGAYRPAAEKLITSESSQAFVNKYVGTVAAKTGAESAWANTLANATNGLRALGYDPQNCFTAGNKMPVDTAALLKALNLEEAQKGWFSTIAPYVLLALRQGSYDSALQQEALLTYLLANVESNSTRIDTYVMMLQGIAPFYATDSRAKAAIDAGLVTIAKAQKSDGSFGNVASTAQVALLFAQLGIAPTTDARFLKGDKNIVTSLIAAVKKDGSMGGGMYDSQGFTALLALAQTMKTKAPYNIYDASAYSKTPAVATGSGTDEKPVDPVAPTTMTLSFTLQGDSVHGETPHSGSHPTWISGDSVTVPTDATAAHVISKALKAKSIVFDESGARGGYLKWIQIPGTQTKLSEFSNGPLSGWKYQVNGVAPTVGITGYTPKNGDKLLLYYTDDYTVEPDAEQWVPSKPKPTVPKTDTLAPSVKTDSSGTAAVTVSKRDTDAALAVVKKNSSPELVIAPVVTGDPSKVQVTLSKSLLADLSADTKAALTVTSPVAKISLSTAALAAIAKEQGSDVSITAQRADAAKLSDENKALVGDHPVYQFSLMVDATAVHELGGAVTVTLPYTLQKGEDPQNLTVYYLDADGKAAELPGARYDSVTKSVVFETSHFSTFAVVYDQPLPFTDVTPKDWFYSAAKFVTRQGLFTGTTETAFSPLDDMSRAMLWTVLYRLSGSPADRTAALDDAWYAAGQRWAVAQNISDGASPEAPISRQELATMLCRYRQLSEKTVPATDVPSFTDEGEIAPWAAESVRWAVSQKLLQGSDGKLMPLQNASRGEVAVILERFATL